MQRIDSVIGLVACLVLGACNGSDGSGSSRGTGGGGDSSDPSGGSGGKVTSGTGGCGELDYVFEPVEYGTVGDVIRDIIVAQDWIYFRSLDDAFRVPLAGGEPEAIDLQGAGPLRMYETNDGVAILANSGAYWTADAGGEFSVRATVDRDFRNGILTLEGDTLYSLRGPTSDEDTIELWSVDLDSGELTSLRSTESALKVRGWNLVKTGDDLFFSTQPPVDFGDPDAELNPPQVMNVWRAGEPTFEVLRDEEGPEPFFADEDYLYFFDNSGTVGGVSRMPLEGGDAEVIVPGGSRLLTNHSAVEDAHIFLSITTLYSVDPSDGEATPFGCLPKNNYTYHALATEGDTAYVSVFRRADEKASIARVRLP